jgi:hypothetical protein
LATAVSAALLAPAAASCAPAERAQARAEQKTVEQAPPVSQPPRRSPADAIAIPAGSFALGSIPGSSGRDPALEADLVALQLPAFEIDRLPYPNDSTKPFRTAIDRDEATALCAQRGKRLCSEQEWERACKATNDALYPTGSRLDLTACKRDPAACATSEGVLALGTSQREWTLSTAASGLGDPSHSAVVRGASVDAAPAQHRCAARAGVAPDTRSADLGFRCCRGGDGDGAIAAYPTEPARELTRGLNLERDALRAALAAVPALGKLAPSFEPFSDADVSAALRRGGQSRDSLRLWTFMPSAFAWSPGPGEELWVLTGRTRDGALLALLYPLGGGRFVHAASTLIAEPDATLAIGASAQYPNQLTWTTCYACAGEGGTIRLRDDARVELVYR